LAGQIPILLLIEKFMVITMIRNCDDLWAYIFYTLNFIYKDSFCILSIKDGNVIARNVFRDEAIPWITPGDCSTAQNAGFGKKRLAMTHSP
jgi:hypothetical protein